MKKSKAKSTKLQPFITLKKERIQPVKLEESFAYLGKNFNFNMNCDERKTELKSEVLKYILTIDKLPLKCRSKIDIVQRYVFSKLNDMFSLVSQFITLLKRRSLSVVILPTLVYQRKCLVSTLKQLNKYKHSVNSVLVEFLKRHKMKKLELCITLPAVKMLNLILSSHLLKYLKTIKLNSTLRTLYRNNLKNLHGTVSIISTNNQITRRTISRQFTHKLAECNI